MSSSVLSFIGMSLVQSSPVQPLQAMTVYVQNALPAYAPEYYSHTYQRRREVFLSGTATAEGNA